MSFNSTVDVLDAQNDLSGAQLKALAIIPLVTGSLSILGSSIILYMILSRRKKRLTQLYHRTMLVLSCYDILWSFWLGMGAIPVPKETGAILAFGNSAACRTQGFMSVFGLAVVLYNAVLMIYFLTIIRWNAKERKLAKTEPYLHAFVFCYCLAVAVFFLVKDMYSMGGLGPSRCGVGSYPPGCETSPEIECETGGEGTGRYSFVFLLVPAFLSFLTMIGCNVMIMLTVFRQSQRSQQQYNERSKENLRIVIKQSCLYFFFFCNTFVWAIIVLHTEASPMSLQFPFEIMYVIFFPLQGFANCLLYLFPRFLRINNLHRSESLCFKLKETVFGNRPLVEQQRFVAHHSPVESSRSTRTAIDEPNHLCDRENEGGDCLDPIEIIEFDQTEANGQDEADHALPPPR